MLKLALLKLASQNAAPTRRITCTAALLAALLAGNAGAQSGGPRYVEDLHQQAMRAPQAGAMNAVYTAPTPSQQSRYPQPTIQSYNRAPQPQAASEGWSATRGFKKALGGLFGGESSAPESPQTSSFAGMSREEPAAGKPLGKPSYAASRRALSNASRAAASSEQAGAKKPLFSLFTSKDQPETPPGANMANRPMTRAGAAPNLGQQPSHQPVGLFARFSKPAEAPSTPAPAIQLASKETNAGRQPAPRALPSSRLHAAPLAKPNMPAQPNVPAEPTWNDDTLVMVTDKQPAAGGASPASAPSGTRIVETPGMPLPVVTGPVVSSEMAKPAASQDLPEVVTPAPVSEVAEAAPTPTAEIATKQAQPQQIVNEHAAPSAQAKQALQPFRPSNRRVDPVKSLASRVANQRTGMPKNPVAPLTAADVQPSPKAVQLLSQANQLSGSAESEEQLTEVVQLCRHVLAIDQSAVAVEYSKDLASWALNRRGEMRHEEGRTKEALLDFEDSLRLVPNRYRAIHNRGVLAAQAGRYADAFDDFNRTIQIEPSFAKAYSNRGTLFVQAGDYQKASTDYLKAISLDPDLAVAHKGRGRVCHLLGEFELALQHLDAASRLSPADANIVCQRGDLLMDMGRYRAAITDYRRAIELDHTMQLGYRSLAWLEATCPDRECRDAQQAIEHAERAMELTEQPGDLEYDTLAAAHAAAGNFDEAVGLMHECMARARGEDKPNYEWRRQLYQRGQAYITEPASDIQQASFAE